MTRALPADLRATVVTHSPTVATALAGHLAIEVYLLGGRLFRHSMVACGAAAVEAAQVVHADLFLVGVTGVLPLGAVAGVITDASAQDETVRRLTAAGVPVIPA